MTAHGQGKEHFKGKRRDVGSVKPKTMSVPITAEESERLQVACWLLETTTSGLMRAAIDQFLEKYKDQIDAAIKAKQTIKQSMPEVPNVPE